MSFLCKVVAGTAGTCNENALRAGHPLAGKRATQGVAA
ncbi:hypothetical protein CSB93_4162 [Pseudomonas paraeruginosa]|uniref:Uncharacterized protein n=1 Tax=Pseudomonas paraeruginosa TaxID=2994495 RepID=A0A2R3J0H7_9PSED|nr:hypothetical protein CSB93_4162 [Pseudomonas paraeruginosa]AWE92400.1 hypothetical protein CSC28_2947 [Pseudomonas paraeruginosa]PTC36687.1 hypothetical protein CLJ1_2828 [Pseudomonas aeruginosa]